MAVGHTAAVQPVPAWVEEPVNTARQSSNGGVTNPFPRNKPARESRLSKLVDYYYAAGGEHDQQVTTFVFCVAGNCKSIFGDFENRNFV